MESGRISYETILHTMQYRGFAAIYDCYLTFKTRVVSLCDIALGCFMCRCFLRIRFGLPALDAKAN